VVDRLGLAQHFELQRVVPLRHLGLIINQTSTGSKPTWKS
jgi:hypothetical protein